MKTLLNFLRQVLRIGSQVVADVVASYSPLLGDLVRKILEAVVNTEAAVAGSGQGSLKSTVVSLALQESALAIEAAFKAAGKPVVNPLLFSDGVRKIQDGIVDILNATGEKAKSPESPASV